MKLRNKIIIPSAITSIFAAITPTVLVSCANTKMVTTDIKTFDPTSVKSVPGTIGASTSIA
ncbi:MAG: hypothetical protein MJ233_04680 [Mycoplasmoidaceae bacterium]|nr:hypothetical protein [Mycoplasmoidaceae bacterium]